MPYKGELKKQTPFTLEVVGAGNDKSAITIVKINRKEKVANADPTTILMGATQTITDQVGLGIDRVMVYVNPPSGGTVRVTVMQGATQFSDVCGGDSILIFDAVA
jgi:hypothetical protein